MKDEAVKLTAAQREILERMASGNEVWTARGRETTAFWFMTAGVRRPRLDTISKLVRAGLIEDRDEGRDWRGAKYRISAAGRLAIEQDTPKAEGG